MSTDFILDHCWEVTMVYDPSHWLLDDMWMGIYRRSLKNQFGHPKTDGDYVKNILKPMGPDGMSIHVEARPPESFIHSRMNRRY